jgi:outer membrane protein OmpA-like peptidoglycan-associated protein
MKKLQAIFLIIPAITILCQVFVKAQSGSDFVSGSIPIFSDNFDKEKLGEFPSKWDLVTGNVEVYSFQDNIMFGGIGSAQVKPLIKQEEYLPEVFTIEFDCYFHLQGNEAYSLNFGKAGMITIRNYFATFKGNKGQTRTISKEPGWMHVAVSFNTRALKVYMNGDRVINMPNVTERPLSVSFEVINFTASKGLPALMDNFIIAEGGMALYDRLMTDGRIVTRDIHFETGKSVLKPESSKVIDQIMTLMNEHPEVKFLIEGHTDSDGGEADNQTLSEKRAAAVKDALVERGIDGNRLTTAGFGESKPVDANETEEGKAMNRRVEFVPVK